MYQVFFKKGADIHTYNDCALKYSCVYENIEMIKYLVENGLYHLYLN